MAGGAGAVLLGQRRRLHPCLHQRSRKRHRRYPDCAGGGDSGLLPQRRRTEVFVLRTDNAGGYGGFECAVVCGG